MARACYVFALLTAAAPSLAQAEGSLAGTWQAGPMRVRVQVESWGGDCGPRPPATSTEPGGVVRIIEASGTLTLQGAMDWSTDGCFTPNRAVRRTSATGGDGSWRVTCRTAPEDARAERGTYTLRATGPHSLQFREESRYDWELKASRCVATRTAERVLTRDAGATPAAAPDPSGEQGARRACTPGPAARLSLTPAETTLEPGERVCFTTRVVDAKGCALPGARVELALQKPPTLAGRLERRCFQAGATSAEAEGTFRVTGSSGALEGSATVHVRSPDLSDLIARGTIETRGAGGADVQAEQGEVARVAARAQAHKRLPLLPWLAGMGVLVLLLAVAAAVGLRRRRQVPGRESGGAGDIADAPRSTPRPERGGAASRICPRCGALYGPQEAFCGNDGSPLEAAV
jgi:hypothetical protein